jgi:hypothetical protein
MKSSKNQVVYQLNKWNNFNTCCIEKLTVCSWGKKKATAKNFKTGHMLLENINLRDGDNDMVFSTREEAKIVGMKINHARIEEALQSKSEDCTRYLKNGSVPNFLLEDLADYAKNGLHVIDTNEWGEEEFPDLYLK